MGKDTSIQWCHHTFNCWRGCTRVSPGCKFCYAETLSNRNPAVLGKWGPNGTRVVASESKWREPMAWDKAAKASGERHRVFCASLADVFEDWQGPMVNSKGQRLGLSCDARWIVPPIWDCEKAGFAPLAMDDVRDRLFTLIDATPNLDWLILTKRPENIPPVCNRTGWSIKPNVWIGASIEDQATADERIPHLLDVPAAVRFLSIEPMLGPIDLGDWDHECGDPPHGRCPVMWPDWVIVGGESGSKARPFDVAWARSIRDQCLSARTPFFMKQMGANPVEYASIAGANAMVRLKDSHGGDWSEWAADLRVREFPTTEAT